MKTKILLNDLLYLEEHLSCQNYMLEVTSGFKYFEFERDTYISEEYTNKNYLLFFLKGTFTISCNSFCNCKFKEGEMVLLPKSSIVKMEVEQFSQLLIMIFDLPENHCDKLALQSLKKTCENIHYAFMPIEINYPLTPFLEILTHCLKNGIQCKHIHSMMQSQYFFLLRGFYKKEMIATLFHPIIGKELSFKNFIIENYPLVDNIEQLIVLSKMGRTSFFVKFREEFGMSAKQWMLKQMKERILGKVMEPGISVKQLTDVCGFESQAQLYRYFRQYFNCTPKELIERYHASS